MFSSLPPSALDCMSWEWPQFEPYFADLAARPLTAANVAEWLADWSRLAELHDEAYWRLYVATTLNTADQQTQQRYEYFVEHVRPPIQQAENGLKQKLLDSGLQPEGFAVPLHRMRAQAEIFREANLPLLAEEKKLSSQFEQIAGAQTVEWEGQSLTLQQLALIYQNPDRPTREQAWRLGLERQITDREAINEVWAGLVKLRQQIADNAGLPDYRAYRWLDQSRFDYTPEDCLTFHRAIEEVVVPAAERIYEKRRRRLGLDTLRPWDISVDPFGRPALRPFEAVPELVERTATIFNRVDPVLGQYFDVMRRENLLDLDSRPNKSPGAYSMPYEACRRPFIFMNAVGTHDDVMTLLHEAGHSFHVFESAHLPYFHQRNSVGVPLEFAEVASMSMELLASPYLPAKEGGFYSDEELARAGIEHLEGIITFWPYMAVVDAYQHWVYTHPHEGADPDRCDEVWGGLWERFMRGVDFTGLEEAVAMRWRRQLHLFTDPFYYVEYGLAQLGAVQVWHNALRDQAGAVAQYRHALSLGGSVSLPEMYTAAGARFAFDADTLRAAVELLEERIEALESLL